MEEIFEECIRIYSAYDKAGAEKIRTADTSAYEFYPTHRGETNLIRTYEGKYLHYHSPEGAVKEAESWFRSLSLSSIDVLYIYGIGLGYYYEAFKKWLYEDSSRFVVFLDDDVAALHMLFKTKRGLEILKEERVIIHTINFVDGAVDFFSDKRLSEIFAGLYGKKPILSTLHMYIKQWEKLILRIKSQIYISLNWQSVLHADKEGLLSKITRNIIGNILRISDTASFGGFEGNFEGIPALICGAGPSIKNELGLLKEAKGKCLMIGSGTGTNVLNRNGIFPHFFVGLDPTATQESRIRMNNSYVSPVFHKLRFSSIASKILSGEHILMKGIESPSTAWFEKELGLEQTKDIETGISSTTFSLGIARMLGCNPIIIVGLDLAYTDNKRYPEGISSIAFGDKKLQDEVYFKTKNLLIGKGYHGEEVLTKIDWLVESDTITVFQEAHPEVLIINATQGGLLIKNVANARLKTLLSELAPIDDMDGRLHALFMSGQLKGITSDKTREIVHLWESHVKEFLDTMEKRQQEFDDSFFETLETASDAEIAIDRLIQEERKKTFFDTFYPSYGEIQRGNLFFAKRCMQRHSVLGDRTAFIKSAREYIFTFFAFWKRIAGEYLEAVQAERRQFEKDSEKFPKAEGELIEPVLLKQEDAQSLEEKIIKKNDGSIFARLQMKNGIYHGSCTYFGDKGEILSKGFYNEGVLDGLYEKYYASGKLYSTQFYKQGLLEGLQRIYFEDGILKASLEYTQGKLAGSVFLYYQSGRTKREIHFKDGLQHGFEKYWDEAGTLLFVSEFKEGKPVAEAWEYYYNGSPLRKTVFDPSGNRISIQEWDMEGNETEKPEEPRLQSLNASEQALEEHMEVIKQLKSVYGSERTRFFY